MGPPHPRAIPTGPILNRVNEKNFLDGNSGTFRAGFENLSTQNSNEPNVFFNINVEFLKVFLVKEI